MLFNVISMVEIILKIKNQIGFAEIYGEFTLVIAHYF